MAVQLLEDWLLKEQEKIITTYRELNQAPLKEPGLIFIGDSIVEYFPIHELLLSPKHMVNRGVRGYKTDLLRKHLDAHVFGTAVDQIFLLIGTNDIGKEIPQKETLDNVEAVLQVIMRDFPLIHINLISVLPVSQEECYKQKVYVRTNEKFKHSIKPIANWLRPTTRSAMSMCIRLYWMKRGSWQKPIRQMAFI